MLLPLVRFDQPFTCIDSTGLPTAPTGTPTGVLVKNGTDLGTPVTVTMTGAQGIASATIPSGTVAGDRFYLRISAVISAVTYVVAGPPDSIESPQTLTSAYDPAKTTAPTAASIAAAVRSDQAIELTRLDVAVGTRLAGASYTAPSSPPTVAAIASQVRSELATELARVDADISSRAIPGSAMSLTNSERLTLAGVIESGFLDDLTGGAFLAGIQSQIQSILDSNTDIPVATIAAAVASAVRTNLATELARLDAAISTRLATTSYALPPSVAGLATSATVSSLLASIEALPAATEIASHILIDPTHKLLTNNNGHVTATNAGGSGDVNNTTFVMPLRSTSVERVQANRIDLFVRERVPLSITIYDAQKQPVNCAGLSCSLFIEGGIELPNLLPSASTLGGTVNRYTFTPPEELTATPATLWFSLRVSDATERVLAFGHLVVAEVP